MSRYIPIFKHTSIYGVIKIGRDYNQSANFIKSLGKDGYYPFINTNMFGLGDYEIPYYYDTMIISFGATYKSFGLDLIDWIFLILKIEHILRNIDFEIAQFHIDSFMRDCTLTWIHKDELSAKDYESDLYQLKKTGEWYFGYGVRSIFTGTLRQELKEYDTLETLGLGFNYPIIFD